MHKRIPANGLMAVLALSMAWLFVPSAQADDNAPARSVTFSADVAPIFAARCVDCHRPGEVAPMSLMTYEDARPWAKSIRTVVAEREMPPWGINPAHGSFSNDMALRDEEIASIIAWVDQGARPGDLSAMPDMPETVEGWKLGEPDYVIELPEAAVPAEGEDMFPTHVVNLDLPGDRWVQAIEFMPGDKSVVHHIVANLGLAGMSEGDGAGATALAARPASAEPSEVFSIYVAGIQPTRYEEGTGRVVSHDQLMSFNMHYHTNGEATTDRTRVGLHFGEGDIEKRVYTVGAADFGFHCPPGDPNFEVRGLHIFDEDATIISFNPHMHVRGADFRYDLIRPDGEREILLDLPKYDYDWQWIYYPTEPIDVPAGSRVEVISHFDNSADNPENPDPTADVYHRGPTFQEMSIGFMELIPQKGVAFPEKPARQKAMELASLHPADDAYLFNFFGYPMGVYLPRTGEDGAWYVAQNAIMVKVSIRDIEWTGDSFSAESTMVMPDGGGVSLLMSGTVGEDGKVTGKFDMGGRPEKQDPAMYPAMVLPFSGSRIEEPREMAAR